MRCRSVPIRLLVALVTCLALLLPTIASAPAMASEPAEVAMAHGYRTGMPDGVCSHDHETAASADHDRSVDAGDTACAADGCALCAVIVSAAVGPLAEPPAREASFAVRGGDAGRSDAPETPPPID